MIRKKLVEKIRLNYDSSMSKVEMLRLFEALLKVIQDTVAGGESLMLPGIGKFSPKVYGEKKMISNFTGKTSILPNRVKLRFYPNKKFEQELTKIILGE